MHAILAGYDKLRISRERGGGGDEKWWQGNESWEDFKVEGDRFWEKFVSDGSNQRWGYKFTVTPEYPPVEAVQTAGAMGRYVELCFAQLDGDTVVGFSSENAITSVIMSAAHRDEEGPNSPKKEEDYQMMPCISCAAGPESAIWNRIGAECPPCSMCSEPGHGQCQVCHEVSTVTAMCRDCLYNHPPQEWLDALDAKTAEEEENGDDGEEKKLFPPRIPSEALQIQTSAVAMQSATWHQDGCINVFGSFYEPNASRAYSSGDHIGFSISRGQRQVEVDPAHCLCVSIEKEGWTTTEKFAGVRFSLDAPEEQKPAAGDDDVPTEQLPEQILIASTTMLGTSTSASRQQAPRKQACEDSIYATLCANVALALGERIQLMEPEVPMRFNLNPTSDMLTPGVRVKWPAACDRSADGLDAMVLHSINGEAVTGFPGVPAAEVIAKVEALLAPPPRGEANAGEEPASGEEARPLGEIHDRCPKASIRLAFVPLETFMDTSVAPPLIKVHSDERFDTYALNMAHHQWLDSAGEDPAAVLRGTDGLTLRWARGAKARFAGSLNTAKLTNWGEEPATLAGSSTLPWATRTASQTLQVGLGQTICFKADGSVTTSPTIVKVEVPEAFEATFYKGSKPIHRHSLSLADPDAARMRAVGGESWVLFAGFHGTAKASLHAGHVRDLVGSSDSIITGSATPHDVTETGKELIAELPEVKHDFEAFQELACGGWTQEADEQLLKKTEEMKVHVLEKADSFENMEAETLARYGGKEKVEARLYILAGAGRVIQERVIPVCNLARLDSYQGQLLTRCRPYIATKEKRKLWTEVMKKTQSGYAGKGVELDRHMAVTLREDGDVDHDGIRSLFGQLTSKVLEWAPSALRTSGDDKGRGFDVKFKGEEGQDWGGVYRSAIDDIVQELHTQGVPLLVQTANNLKNDGAKRECWTLNPSAKRLSHKRQFQFLGMMLGLSLRMANTIPLRLHPMVWKKIVGEAVTREDLDSLDHALVHSLDELRKMSREAWCTPEVFSSTFFNNFTTPSAANTAESPDLIELKVNGNSIDLTLDKVDEWIELVEEARMNEIDTQVEHVRSGLATVVPVHLLALWTGTELEHEVCGSPEVDIDTLKKHAIYDGYEKDSEPVKFLWETLTSLSNEDREDFLHFVWGRSRLPSNEAGWTGAGMGQVKGFKISRNRDLGDASLPLAHTCFFQIELPQYSSAEICKEKILYAIRNCRGFLIA